MFKQSTKFPISGESDFNITDQPIVIPIGESHVCFEVLAVDDGIIENEEEFIVVFEPANANDMLNGNTTMNIVDNDCKIG